VLITSNTSMSGRWAHIARALTTCLAIGATFACTEPVAKGAPTALQLSDGAAQAWTKHVELWARRDDVSAQERACRLLASSNALQTLLGEEMTRRQHSLFAGQSSTAAFDDFRAAIARADTALPGLDLIVGAESVRAVLRYDELAASMPPSSPDRRLLDAMADLASHVGVPVYFEPITEVAACARPEALTERLHRLAAVWPAASACLRDGLAPSLRQAASSASSHGCQCATKVDAQLAIERVIAAYDALADLGGFERLPRPTQASQRFECRDEAGVP